MVGYWIRHRLLFSLLFGISLALVAGLLFVSPAINKNASSYNSQSIYRNTAMDFIVPEPSFDQIQDLPGKHGIESIFPYYLTKVQVGTNGKTRTTTVLLSDQFQNVDISMYNPDRLIKQSKEPLENPILVDWQFCYDTSADIGDVVSFTLNGTNVQYQIFAIYETNSIYDGGAVLVNISSEQKEAIASASKSNGYSGAYINASDYDTCKSYLTTDYRPLGRLKDREQFESDDQYQVHYNAIMSSGYANEITDFRIRESSVEQSNNSLTVWLGSLLSVVFVFAFTLIMCKRGCEKTFFIKQYLPKGRAFMPYYYISFVVEIVAFSLVYSLVMFFSIRLSSTYIPKTACSYILLVIPIAVFVSELISVWISRCFIQKKLIDSV